MARPMKPLVKSGGYYPSNRWIPLVYPGGYTTMNSGGEPTPSVVWVTVSGASPLSLVNAAASNIRSLTQFGKCTQEAGATLSTPKGIYCNNGVLKCSANMANVNAQTARIGYYISAGGVVTADAGNWFYQAYIPVKPNTTYTLSLSRAVYFVSISEYSTAEDSGFIIRKAGSSGSNTALTITTGATTNFVRFGTNIGTTVTLELVLAINWMLNLGGTAMDYQPYVEGGIYTDGTDEVLTVSADGAETQTVTDIPMLLSVGDYKDECEIISGIKTGKVGVKVFDGTETATLQSINSYGIANFYIDISNKVPSVAALLSTHFRLQTSSISETKTEGILNGATSVYFRVNSDTASTPQELSALFAAQYAAGTPVIVLYPLATETTEQTTPQPLRTAAGDNTVSAVSNVDPVELSVEYAQHESGGS